MRSDVEHAATACKLGTEKKPPGGTVTLENVAGLCTTKTFHTTRRGGLGDVSNRSRRQNYTGMGKKDEQEQIDGKTQASHSQPSKAGSAQGQARPWRAMEVLPRHGVQGAEGEARQKGCVEH